MFIPPTLIQGDEVAPKNDLVGIQVGKLEVLGFVGRARHGSDKWMCRCDCGNTSIVHGTSLRTCKTKSCGCIRKETAFRMGSQRNKLKTVPGTAAKNAVLIQYKSGANKRGLCWSLTDPQALALFEGACEYCGNGPSNIKTSKKYIGNFVYNGIDRLDNSRGYEEGNVVSCCITCNKLKMNRKTEEFFESIKRIYEFSRLGD